MKKIILLFLILTSCSNDDEVEQVFTEEIEIVSHKWEKADRSSIAGQDHWRMRIIAKVKNNSNQDKKGKVRFVIDRESGEVSLYSYEIIIPGKFTMEISDLSIYLFSQQSINDGYDKVEFVDSN